MVESRLTRVLLRLGAGATLAFIYLPLLLIAVYAFNESVTQSWPIEDFSTKWFSAAWNDEQVRDALWLSVQAALGATLVALVLGHAALARGRALQLLRPQHRLAARRSCRSRCRGSSPGSRSRRPTRPSASSTAC